MAREYHNVKLDLDVYKYIIDHSKGNEYKESFSSILRRMLKVGGAKKSK